MEMENLS